MTNPKKYRIIASTPKQIMKKLSPLPLLLSVIPLSLFLLSSCSKSKSQPSTPQPSTLTITNPTISAVSRNSAYCTATITVENETILAQGFCADTTSNPSLSTAKFVVKGTGTNLADSVTGLLYNNTYYVRA
jgi:hypothetical protein